MFMMPYCWGKDDNRMLVFSVLALSTIDKCEHFHRILSGDPFFEKMFLVHNFFALKTK
jgi:hypothetical protein